MAHLAPPEPPSSLPEQATRLLRRKILTAALAPGESLPEAQAAERLGLGKAPVRAALARLAEEGLVRAPPPRGSVVALATIRDIHEGFDLRLLVEPEAARRAAGRVDGDALRRLDAVCAAGYRPQDADSALAFLDANRAFHVAAADPFGNGASPARSAGCSTRARTCASSASSAATAAARWRASTPR